MHIEIDSIADIAKAFTQKREKKDDDTEAVIGHLKFSGCFVSREAFDEMLGQLIGWSQSCLFDDFGMPTVRAEIALPFFSAELTGVIAGVQPIDEIRISKATITAVKLALTKMGAYLSAEIAWEIAGDESSQLVPLQGNECRVHFVLQEPQQLDLVQKAHDSINQLRKAGITLSREPDDGDADPAYETAVEFVRAKQVATVSKLQRHCKIGYNRAERLLDLMEANGVVGQMQADGSRAYVGGQAAGEAH